MHLKTAADNLIGSFQAFESGTPGGGLSGTVGCNGRHDELLAKPKGSVYRSLWEENMKQQHDDEETPAPVPTLQRQTTQTVDKFGVLKHSISSLRIDEKRKHAIMDIIGNIEVDCMDMERALEENTLEAALTNATTHPADLGNADVDTADVSTAADAAALVRTITGGSTKSGLAKFTSSDLARRRWRVATTTVATTTAPRGTLRRMKTVG